MEVNPIKNLKDIEKIKRYLLKMDNKRLLELMSDCEFPIY